MTPSEYAEAGEKIEYNNQAFTFERVESIKELPVFRYQVEAESHEEALTRWKSIYKTHVKYCTQELNGKKVNVYAFVRPEWIERGD